MLFRSNRDAYVRLYHVDTAGKTRLVFPHAYAPDAAVRAEQVLRIPAKGAPFSLRTGEPFGAEMIKAVASRSPLPSPSAGWAAGGSPFAELGASPGPARELRKSLEAAPPGGLAEDACAFSVMPK